MVSGPTIIDAKTKQDMCFTICNFDKETKKYVFNPVDSLTKTLKVTYTPYDIAYWRWTYTIGFTFAVIFTIIQLISVIFKQKKKTPVVA